mgnify:CR=1 FL=1
MKQRTEKTWSKNDNWETKDYILDWIKREIFDWQPFFDPCPLSIEDSEWNFQIQFDGLAIDWKTRNFINPPYNITDKPKFVKKAFDESKKWNTCVLLLPATTETKWFHDYLANNACIYLIKWRVKFKWYNSKWEYVTNKTGQSGSMICVLWPGIKPGITTLEIDHI